MNNNILKYLISNPSLALWTRDKDIADCSKAVCALANNNGGCIVVGIGDDLKVVGVDTSENDEFVNLLFSSVQPQPPFSVAIAELDEKKVLLVNVWEGNNKPYTTYDAFYTMKGDVVCKASLNEVSCMSKNTYNLNFGWERQKVSGLELSDLSKNALSRFRKVLLDTKRILPDDMDLNVVQKLGFLSNDKITNAGAVVLCDTPAVYLPQTRIRVSVFGAENKLLDVHLYDCNLLESVDRIVDYVKGLYPKRFVINGLERSEEEILPIIALREGLLNAIVHRRYDSYDSYVALTIYEDYLEIVNSGSLPSGMKVENLTENHRSILRNPDIANAFYTIGYIEMAGSGTLRIIDECKKYHCEVPTWIVTGDVVVLRFNGVRHNLNASKREHFIDINSVSSDVSVRESLVRILDFMKTHENVKLLDVTSLLNKSYPSVKRYMRILKDASLIEYRGNNRSGGWFLK